jgi:ribulose-phosphate 3-epimerase
MGTSLRIAASLASAPLDHLSQVISELEHAGVDEIHFDVEDGTFVPMISLGIKIIGDLRSSTNLPFDVHLMMTDPEWILPEVVKRGANRISIHYEACAYPRRTLREITSLGVQAGIAFNPSTPLPELSYLLPYLSFVVILTTEPEKGSGPFLMEILRKICVGKNKTGGDDFEWVVDGGVRPEYIQEIAASGANTVVVGRAIFEGGRIAGNVAALRAAYQGHNT